jgi:hypothetical protein
MFLRLDLTGLVQFELNHWEKHCLLFYIIICISAAVVDTCWLKDISWEGLD